MPDAKPTGTGPASATATPKAGTPGATGNPSSPSAGSGPAGGGAGLDYEAKAKDFEKKYKDTDKELKQARAAIEQHARAQNTEVENMKEDFEKLEAKSEAFEEFKYSTFLELAILKAADYQWYDVEDVRAAINLDDVEIDDDGKITGLEDALKDVAARKPHLMKPSDGQQQQGTPVSVIPTHQGPSGAQPTGTPGGNADYDVEALKKKYKIA